MNIAARESAVLRMTLHSFARWAAAAILLFVLAPSGLGLHCAMAGDPATRPNIVFILADDQGWNGTSVQMHPEIPDSRSDYYRTPNIERLARAGLRFSNAYAPGPMCTPTRASLQTGKSPAQLGMTNVGRMRPATPSQPLLLPPHTSELALQETTIGELLQDAGYATASFGKWHLGGEQGPGSHGYDEHDGPTGNSEGNTGDPDNPKDVFGITRRGMSFIERSVRNGKPFYLQLWHYAVHGPIASREATAAACAARRSGRIHSSPDFAAMTEDLDAGVGMILDKLEQLSILENTYIVYMSDHGAGLRLSSNAPLRQGKGTLWEGGLRVPLIICGPGVMPGGFCQIPTVGWDLFPTFLELAGVSQQPPAGLEGCSLRPVLGTGSGRLMRNGFEIAFHYPHYREEGRAGAPPHSMIIVDDFKLMRFYGTDQLQLFNLKQDIGEQSDLSGELSAKTAMLQQRLADYLESVNAGLPRPNPDFDPRQQRAAGGSGPGNRRGRERLQLVDRFDRDEDGMLNQKEREQARKFLRSESDRDANAEPAGPAIAREGDVPHAEPTRGRRVRPDDVAGYADRPLYDETVLRTLFLDFEHDDWEGELADFYRTDVDVPAKLTVDGRSYKSVGVRFRGNSSFFNVAAGRKKSFNITLDFVDKDQALYGYRTINLLNAHTDPSFVREVLYNRVARHYVPAPQASFAEVVVNGESWGVFVNVQQFNKDFVEEWFGERNGVRWKVPAGGGSARSLIYAGDDPAEYASYELKSADNEQARADLIRLCKALQETPVDELDTRLNELLNIDRVLWFLALDNLLIDTDGYYARGSDYLMYQDQRFGRFHVLPYDSNETFRVPSRSRRSRRAGRRGRPDLPRPGASDTRRGASGRGQSADIPGRPGDAEAAPVGFALSPFAGEEREDLPLLHRLLANPRLRARYIAHVRTIAEDWLDWQIIGPVVADYRQLIDDAVRFDTRKMSSYEDFVASVRHELPAGRRTVPGLQPFVEARRQYLLSHRELAKPAPRIVDLTQHVVGAPGANGVKSGQAVRVRATISAELAADEVLLYVATSREAPFSPLPMFDDGRHEDGQAGDGVFAAVIPRQLAGSHVHYYVEARSSDAGTSSFEPEACELHARNYRVEAPLAAASVVVINEVLAVNTSIKDPQGHFDDWVELHNKSDQAVDLSGMFLSDKRDNPRKWRFPAGTTIPAHGYLIVWADEDANAQTGLHAGFKLSRSGETLLLIDTDERGNAILDIVEFNRQEADQSWGRYPDGGRNLRPLKPSPGKNNKTGA